MPFAQELRGAREIIRLSKQVEQDGGIQGEFKKLADQMPSMSPDQQAKGWSALAIKYAAKPEYMSLIMNVLPPPASWKGISAELANANVPASIKLIGALLGEDTEAQRRHFQALQQTGGVGINELGLALAIQWGDGGMAGTYLDRVIAEKNKAYAEASEGAARYSRMSNRVVVPDLEKVLGKERAAAVYLRVLKTAKVPLTFAPGAASIAARELALKQGSTFGTAQYGLIDSLESAALYPVFARFPTVGEDGEKSQAQALYIMSEVFAGRGMQHVGQAKALAALPDSYGPGSTITSRLTEERFAKPAFEFLHAALQNSPTLSVYEYYGAAAIGAGRISEAIGVLTKIVNTPTAKKDRSNPAFPTLIQLMGINGDNQGVINLTLRAAQDGVRGFESRVYTLGKILGRQDLVTMAVNRARTNPGYGTFDILLQEKLFGEAEAQFLQEPTEDSYYSSDPSSLVRLYHLAGRYQDVIDVLDYSEDWDSSDLSEAIDGGYGEQDSTGYYAAYAFNKTGKKDLAIKVALATLEKDPAHDPTYDLLIELLGPEGAVAKFDELFAADRYQERPLIFKGKVLHSLGKYDEAEAAIRQAIAIDPSDGEMKFGRRMYVYAVLAGILEAKNKGEEAKVYRSAVEAIRLSETADKFLEVGLVREALNRYDHALTIFSDAYCIQSRLAVNLVAEGKLEEAAEHFRRAFELMPSSFGRIETHCFGCEGVFRTGPAAEIADKVLSEEVKKPNARPQAHYLLAYLRYEQERYEEAAAGFRQATKMDPEYFNAWQMLQGLAAQGVVGSEEALQIAEIMQRLDPRGRYSSGEGRLTASNDLKAVYELAVNGNRGQATGQLYELRASAAKMKSENEGMSSYRYGGGYGYGSTGGSAVSSTPIMRSILSVLGGYSYYDE